MSSSAVGAVRAALRRHPMASLWGAAAVVHLVVIGMSLLFDQQDSDIALYAHWMELGLDFDHWPVLTGHWAYANWVYPVLALLPMLAATAVGKVIGFTAGWFVVTTAASLAGMWLATGRGKRLLGGWYWLAFILLIGPVALSRLDIFVALSTAVVLTYGVTRPRVAALAMTIGAWVKVVPALLLIPLFATTKRRWRDIIVPAGLVSVLVIAAVALSGGNVRSLSFLLAQDSRGLQTESPAAALVLLLGLADPLVRVHHNTALITDEVRGGLTDIVTPLVGVLMPIALVAIAWLVWKARTRTTDALLWGSLAVLAAGIVFNKVGSPQFHLWLVVPLAFGLGLHPNDRRWRRLAGLGLADAAATFLIFPVFFQSLLAKSPGAVLLLGVRSALVITIFVIAIRTLAAAARAADAVAPGAYVDALPARSGSFPMDPREPATESVQVPVGVTEAPSRTDVRP